MNKKIIVSLALLLSFSISMLAQSPKAVPQEQNDPAAKRVLDKIRNKYEGYRTFEAAFKLSVELPGQEKSVEEGVVAQAGDQFRLNMSQQVIINDTKTTWVYLPKNNEVQINDSEPSDSDTGFLTPKELLRRYQKGDFLYAITDKISKGSKVLTQIEFKPKDRNSDYSKLRLSIDEKAGTIESIKAFGKDGSRYTFAVTRFSPNKPMTADYFSFDEKKYPGVHVEDLRM